MQLIHDCIIPRQIIVLVYLLYTVYAKLKYSDGFKNTIMKCILCVLDCWNNSNVNFSSIELDIYKHPR